jgi:hypothetical protein
LGHRSRHRDRALGAIRSADAGRQAPERFVARVLEVALHHGRGDDERGVAADLEVSLTPLDLVLWAPVRDPGQSPGVGDHSERRHLHRTSAHHLGHPE